jgi:hypothetical protein
MKKILASATGALLLSQAVLAGEGEFTTISVPDVTTQGEVRTQRTPSHLEPSSVIYRDHVLTIPHGTVIDEHGAVHYRNIQLVEVGPNTFQVASAEQGLLASVDSVEVFSDGSGKVEVVVEGAQSTACVDILDPVVSFKDDVFTVVLAETAPESDVCIMMLVYYESVFELETGDLEAGEYSVVVNGVEASFSLD